MKRDLIRIAVALAVIALVVLVVGCGSAATPEWEQCNATSVGKFGFNGHGTDCQCQNVATKPGDQNYRWNCGGDIEP